MSISQNPEMLKRMKFAETILQDSYRYFEKLIKKFEVKLDSPGWDIICFNISIEYMNKRAKEEIWYKFWSKNRKPLVFENFQYQIPSSYFNLCCSKESSKYLINILDYFKKNNHELTWSIFLPIFFKYRSKVMPKFNTKEFQVFQTILRKQTLSNNELLENLLMDSSNLSKYKRKLRDKQLIYEGLTLNHSVLNLAVYGVVFTVALSSKINFFKELPESSFLHSIYTSHSNSQTVMIHYVAPDKSQVSTDLNKLVSLINERNEIISSNVFKFDVHSRLKSFNFSNYDYKNARWNLPYFKIVSALEGDNKNSLEGIPFIFSEFELVEKKVLNLNKTGIEILNHLLMRNEMSINAIRKDLEISEKEARKHIENFQKRQYFKSRINPNYVFGLSNLVIFMSRDPSEQLKIHKQLSIFPELYSQKFSSEEDKGLHFIIRIPTEMIFDCMSLFNKFFKGDIKEQFVINQMYRRRWKLPTERYETVFQEWKYDSQDILGGIE